MSDFVRIFGILFCGIVAIISLVVSVKLIPSLQTPKSLWLKHSIAGWILFTASFVAFMILAIVVFDPVFGFSALSSIWIWLVFGIPIFGFFLGVLMYWKLDALEIYSRGLLNLSDYLQRRSHGKRKGK